MNDIVNQAAQIIRAVYGPYERSDGVDASVDRAQALADAGLLATTHDIDRYRKATGGLEPALVAKVLHWAMLPRRFDPMGAWFTDAEMRTLHRATFEVTP